MRLICPSCGATHSADGISDDADARLALMTAAELPADLGPLVLRYIGLFRPMKSRNLAWHRVRKLITELAEMIEAGKVRRNGRDWPAPASAWRVAIDQILSRRDAGKLRLPMESHGYLLEILTGEADKAEAQAEDAVESARRRTRAGDADPFERPAAAPAEPPVSIDLERFDARVLDIELKQYAKLRMHPTAPGLAEALRRERVGAGMPPPSRADVDRLLASATARVGAPLHLPAPAPPQDVQVKVIGQALRALAGKRD